MKKNISWEQYSYWLLEQIMTMLLGDVIEITISKWTNEFPRNRDAATMIRLRVETHRDSALVSPCKGSSRGGMSPGPWIRPRGLPLASQIANALQGRHKCVPLVVASVSAYACRKATILPPFAYLPDIRDECVEKYYATPFPGNYWIIFPFPVYYYHFRYIRFVGWTKFPAQAIFYFSCTECCSNSGAEIKRVIPRGKIKWNCGIKFRYMILQFEENNLRGCLTHSDLWNRLSIGIKIIAILLLQIVRNFLHRLRLRSCELGAKNSPKFGWSFARPW